MLTTSFQVPERKEKRTDYEKESGEVVKWQLISKINCNFMCIQNKLYADRILQSNIIVMNRAEKHKGNWITVTKIFR